MKAIIKFLALGLFAGTLNATVMDFESGSINQNGEYTLDGFTLSVNNWTTGNAAIQTSQNPGNNTNIFAFCSTEVACTADTSLTLSASSAFSLTSIDFANWMPENIEGNLDIVGFFDGGGSISTSFSTNNTWQTMLFGGYTNLISLNISGTEVYAFDIDNVTLNESAIPEPSIITLMGLGIFGLALLSRRKMKK